MKRVFSLATVATTLAVVLSIIIAGRSNAQMYAVTLDQYIPSEGAVPVDGAAIHGDIELTPGVQVDTFAISSQYIVSPAKFVVAVPASYFENPTAEYPTVYLLNGHGGGYKDYASHFDLGHLADKYEVIIVCPDGRNSWYYDSPVNPRMQMESYVTTELIPCIDNNLRTVGDSHHRAITGLSMGGHGAFWLGMRHPDLFGSIGSMSGGLDISKFPNNSWNVKDVLGPYDQDPQRWIDHSAISLVPALIEGEQNIIFDCGTEDFFFDVNNAMDKALTDSGITHTYTTRSGNHSWNYWKVSLPRHLKFFKEKFD